MIDECCETCRHWRRHAIGPADDGTCHRFPPQLNPAAAERIAGLGQYRRYDEYAATEAAYWSATCWSFPVISSDEWCGEYAPKPDRAGSPSV